MAKPVELKIHYILKDKCHDGVPIENEVAVVIHLFRHVPSVNVEHARGSAVQAKAHDLSIVKAWNTSEPCDQIEAARDAGVGCFGFLHVLKKSNYAPSVKSVRFGW